jgi:hypothetical protein
MNVIWRVRAAKGGWPVDPYHALSDRAAHGPGRTRAGRAVPDKDTMLSQELTDRVALAEQMVSVKAPNGSNG